MQQTANWNKHVQPEHSWEDGPDEAAVLWVPALPIVLSGAPEIWAAKWHCCSKSTQSPTITYHLQMQNGLPSHPPSPSPPKISWESCRIPSWSGTSLFVLPVVIRYGWNLTLTLSWGQNTKWTLARTSASATTVYSASNKIYMHIVYCSTNIIGTDMQRYSCSYAHNDQTQIAELSKMSSEVFKSLIIAS